MVDGFIWATYLDQRITPGKLLGGTFDPEGVLNNISAIDWHILHERQPLYTMMSDGSVQNKYTFKILNKTKKDLTVRITTEGVEAITVTGIADTMVLRPDKLIPFNVYIRAKPAQLPEEHTPVTFVLQNVDQPDMVFKTKSVIVRPPR